MRLLITATLLFWANVLTANNDWLTQPPIFDATYYSETHEDLERAFRGDEKELKKHWLRFGIEEGRASSPVMNVQWYVATNPDLQSAFGEQNYRDALKHWIDHGIAEGRAASPDFDPRWYVQQYPDVAAAFGATHYLKAVMHYLEYGLPEGRYGAPPPIMRPQFEFSTNGPPRAY